tara:strand:+ start:1024 stop:2592 length:1569 start_codon:yes stop_codon:yes gene_type:complete
MLPSLERLSLRGAGTTLRGASTGGFFELSKDDIVVLDVNLDENGFPIRDEFGDAVGPRRRLRDNVVVDKQGQPVLVDGKPWVQVKDPRHRRMRDDEMEEYVITDPEGKDVYFDILRQGKPDHHIMSFRVECIVPYSDGTTRYRYFSPRGLWNWVQKHNTIPGAEGQPVWKEDWWALHYTYDPNGAIPDFVSTLKTCKEYVEELEEARRRVAKEVAKEAAEEAQRRQAAAEAQRHQEESRQRARLQEEARESERERRLVLSRELRAQLEEEARESERERLQEEARDSNDVHVNWRFFLKGIMSDAEVENVKNELETNIARYIQENDYIESGIQLHVRVDLKRGFLLDDVMGVYSVLRRARRVYYFDDGDVSRGENDSVPVIEVRYDLMFHQTRNYSDRSIQPEPLYSAQSFRDDTEQWYDEMEWSAVKEAIAEMCGIGPIEISDRSLFSRPTIAQEFGQAERYYDNTTQRDEENTHPLTIDLSPPLPYMPLDYLANDWENWHIISPRTLSVRNGSLYAVPDTV